MKMKKERGMAIFIGLIMVLSAGGFALMYVMPEQAPPGTEIPNIVNRQLTDQEIVWVLRTGRVLIEDFYPPNCSRCLENNMVLEMFAQSFPQFIVLEEVASNTTLLQMLGRDGMIRSLGGMEINSENLMDVFCDMAILQPRECLLREV